MSYDLEIATHQRPAPGQIERWAEGRRLRVQREGDAFVAIEKPSRGGATHVCTVDGPHAAEPEDFAEEVAANCLAPRWMTTVSVPYSSPKASVAAARSLARHLAEANDGAAFDPQQDALIWPRGRLRRVAARSEEEATTKVGLTWFLPPARWEAAPAALLALLKRHCPEALPTRFGQWEPPPHRFDPANPDAFTRFALENEDGGAFWYASRPSFGGACTAPYADKYPFPEDDPYRVARIEVDFDGNVLDADPRWREAVADLFVAAAVELGAFFAAGQAEPGWIVTRNNRLFSVGHTSGEHILRGKVWQGLPPVPMWLSWFGEPYRELVADQLLGWARATGAPARVEDRAGGLFVRVSEHALTNDELAPMPLPHALTYAHRPPTVDERGAITWHPAQREDRAAVIPKLTT